jgi:hypothetical protein
MLADGNNKTCLQPDINLGKILAKPIRALSVGKMVFGLIECFEERNNVTLISFLCTRDSTFVDAIIDLIVLPIVCCINLAL